VLARVLPYMPVGVHVGVVDPGVGTHRKALALGGRDGRFYVGPDNGLLVPAAEALGGVADAVEISNRAYMLERVSRTFHGRDVFSPAAAHLALGAALADLGPRVAVSELARLEIPEPDVAPFWLGTTVLSIDRFGNVQLSATGDDLVGAGVELGMDLELEVGEMRHDAVAGVTFADVASGDLVVYEDSYGRVAVAVNGGSAAERLGASPGTRIGIACS
jgi:S-adenosylmethionine hydrolase